MADRQHTVTLADGGNAATLRWRQLVSGMCTRGPRRASRRIVDTPNVSPREGIVIMAQRTRRWSMQSRSRRRNAFGPSLILVFLAGVVLFIVGHAHLHDAAVPAASTIMIVGICLAVLAPITYVVSAG